MSQQIWTFYTEHDKRKSYTDFDYYRRNLEPREKASNLSDFFAGRVDRHFRYNTCRELLVPDLGMAVQKEPRKKFSEMRLLLTGDIFHYNAKGVKRTRQGRKTLENFLRKVYIKSLKLRVKKLKDHVLPSQYKKMNTARVLENYNLAFELTIDKGSLSEKERNAFGVIMTSLMGLLKEYSILEKIMSKEINTIYHLSREFLILAVQRRNGVDNLKFLSWNKRNRVRYSELENTSRTWGRSYQTGSGDGWFDTLMSSFILEALSKNTYKIPWEDFTGSPYIRTAENFLRRKTPVVNWLKNFPFIDEIEKIVSEECVRHSAFRKIERAMGWDV
jgi:hypothetical protein